MALRQSHPHCLHPLFITEIRSATTVTQTQLAAHASRMIEKINPEHDTTLISQNIPRLLVIATPKPQFYHNYHVGECRDLIFGVSLVDYATAKGLGEGEIPKIVRICIREIDERGLDAEGIYRVSLSKHLLDKFYNMEIGFWQARLCTGGESTPSGGDHY